MECIITNRFESSDISNREIVSLEENCNYCLNRHNDYLSVIDADGGT